MCIYPTLFCSVPSSYKSRFTAGPGDDIKTSHYIQNPSHCFQAVFFFPTVLNGHLDLKWQKPVYGVFMDFLTMKNTAELLKFSTVFSAVLMRCARF